MKELLNYLYELKTYHNAVGIKAEFETEGLSFEDMCMLKDLSERSDLPLSIKISGCGDIRGLIDTQKIKADTIVAPMIESPYALQKFVTSFKSVYSNTTEQPKLYINIETIQAINNLDSIFESKYINDIDGIVLGRGDLAGSLDTNVNDKKIENIIQLLIDKTKKYGKNLIIGGKISPDNILNIPNSNISGIETRKIIFKPPFDREGLIKAIEFEIKWIKNKPSKNNLDGIRSKELQLRLTDFIQ